MNDAHTVTALGKRNVLGFAAFALAALTAEQTMTRTAAFQRGTVVPLAILFDLVIVVPLVFGAIVLRPARRSQVEAAPIVALGAFVAGVLLAGRSEMRMPLRAAGALAEIAVLTLLVLRVRKARAQLRSAASDDLLLRIGTLTDPVLRLAGAELLVFYYALVGPFVRRPPRPNDFGYTQNSGLGGVLLAFGLVTSIETFVTHLLLVDSSPRAAWVLTALGVYSVIGLAAAFQAARLRPVVVSGHHLLVRTSLLWTIEVPRDAIASVAAIENAPREKGILRAALGTAPVVLVTLNRPIVARGPMGLRRSVRGIALYVDEPERLRAALDAG